MPQNRSNTIQDGWKGFKLALAVLKQASVVFPPLQAALGALLKVVETIDQVSDNQDNFNAVTRQITHLSALIRKYEGFGMPRNIRDRLDGFTQRLKFIEDRMHKGTFGRILDASGAANDIANSLRELGFAVELFQIDTALNTEAQSLHILCVADDIHERELLKILDAATGAPYNESSRSGCMDGTRVDTLTRLLAWTADPNSLSIYWLSGMAGIGKSAIAQSLCRMIDDGRLGGSFFCSRQAKSLNKVNHILPTIAYQLAFRSQAYRLALVEILKQTSRRSYRLATLQEQARDLFIEPLRRSRAFAENAAVIVIDALDECTSRSAVSDLLRVILRSDLPLKFLITSRPEVHIDKSFSAQKSFEIDATLSTTPGFRSESLVHASLRLHDVESDVVGDDITRYLTSKISSLLDQAGVQDVQSAIDGLARMSGGLFIFAFTAVQYISLGASSNLTSTEIQRRLSILLLSSDSRHSDLPTRTINDLYKHIFVDTYYGKNESEIAGLRRTLDTLLCLREPQSVSVIATFLGEQKHDIRTHFGNFSSVLDLPQSDDIPVAIFHASFADYVFDRRRSGTYTLNAGKQHQELAFICFKLMNSLLHEDICDIRVRQTHNADVTDLVVHKRIPPALRYACVFWASHLAMGDGASDSSTSILEQLKMFVDNHLLHWLECLSLIRELHIAFSCIQKAKFYLSGTSKTSDLKAREDMLLDVQHMVPQCYYFLKSYALEVYVSALAWLPTESTLRAKYANKAPRILQGLDNHWGACLQMLQSKSWVHGLAYSPSGINLACGSEDSFVRIWNLETGEMVKELAGHTGPVIPVAYSSDELKLASGSVDETVRIWNLETGEPIRILSGHTKRVNTVVFSPDGLTLASGSDDRTVRIWNSETGNPIAELVGHSGWVSAVAFFPDGSKLVSGSADETVRIWAIEAGVMVKILLGHTAWIRAIAVSPDGFIVASGSADKTIRIWKCETGEFVRGLLGHTDQVKSVSFSPDGTQLASGSEDETVRIWNVQTGELTAELLGHASWLGAVKFSPDGRKLASGSADKNIRIWNVESSQPATQLAGHTEQVSCMAFSPDQSLLASGSDDKVVKIWNVETGEFMQELLGHTHCITAVAFSPDGCKLASGSEDMTMKIWNAKTGEVRKELLDHSRWVTSLVFSSDGSRLASGSDDATLRVWDVEAGGLMQEVVGHEGWITSIALSPDGTRLASGSDDSIVRIWDTATGKLRNNLAGHSDTVSSLLFSPDGLMLASGSTDRTVRVWSTETGDLIKELQNYRESMEPVVFSQDESQTTPAGAYILADDQQCIAFQTADGGYKPQLWIWGEYLRNLQNGIYHSSFSSTRGCLGYATGRVVILDLSND